MSKKVLSLLIAIVGLIAVTLAIVGVATRNWVSVQGNTNELRTKFDQLLDENGTFVVNASGNIVSLLSMPSLAKQVVIGLANATLIQVERQLSSNLQPTTYSLFDKKIAATRTTVPEFKLPQGLVIAGLICLFIGTSLATIILFIHGSLRSGGLFAIVPLFFLVLGSIIILLGYLLFTKIITEDFGHDLGIKVSLGYSFILVAISSIIGFLTAVSFASSLISHVKTTGTTGQAVGLKERRPVPVAGRVALRESF
ncbi:unnamed protein product [Didymodactylos carnosus]|uniref:Uncharacterized protein n=1 Tax=Didymodactylos carnosus TaxID=1234261 RepID=A0A815YEB1_9BILA|nr:unnamed protein product [Didymodactylos carnosus]CAF1568983.1 unnamed protein product [Didymodactylos carnosus]CAF4240655.1 unnamed protein product [Didymodactylos carnosus]CAF4431748.1 unnamed protein product [Didymodactylos carnosus]